MKKKTERGLTELADAAFKRAAEKVIQRAENTGTPVIVCIGNEVKAVPPHLLRIGKKKARRSKVNHSKRASK